MGKAPVLTIPGRTFDVDVYHAQEDAASAGATADQACEIAALVHEREDPGDILMFLTGQEEIDRAVRALKKRAELERYAFDERRWRYDAASRTWVD
jgi:HrpA-like RNA helicase